MRELTSVDRTKKVFQLSEGEFLRGEWLASIQDSEFLEVQYLGSKHVLIIKDAVIKSVKLGDENGTREN